MYTYLPFDVEHISLTITVITTYEMLLSYLHNMTPLILLTQFIFSAIINVIKTLSIDKCR